MHQTWLDPLRPPYRTRRHGSLSAEARATSHPLTDRAAQGPARRRRSHSPERYYVGRRLDATEVHIVSRAGLEPLPHLNYQSSEAFDWGRSTAGALELAFAMLACTTQTRPTDLVCRTFCAQVVAWLDPAGFVVSHDDIALWLLIASSDAYIPPREQSPGDHPGTGRLAARWIRSWLQRS